MSLLYRDISVEWVWTKRARTPRTIQIKATAEQFSRDAKPQQPNNGRLSELNHQSFSSFCFVHYFHFFFNEMCVSLISLAIKRKHNRIGFHIFSRNKAIKRLHVRKYESMEEIRPHKIAAFDLVVFITLSDRDNTFLLLSLSLYSWFYVRQKHTNSTHEKKQTIRKKWTVNCREEIALHKFRTCK